MGRLVNNTHPRNEYMRNWRENNKEKIKEINKRYYLNKCHWEREKNKKICQENQILKQQ